METIKVINSKEPILFGLNFMCVEFFSPPIQPPNKEFQMYTCLPKALQILRNWFSKKYGCPIPWEVTSTLRIHDPIDGPPAHRLEPPAVDSICYDQLLWPEIENMIRTEMKVWETSELMQNILATGTNVIIIENGCLHMHWRADHNHHPDDTKYTSGLYIGEWGIKDGQQFDVAYSHN
jgi:hypothetical protein